MWVGPLRFSAPQLSVNISTPVHHTIELLASLWGEDFQGKLSYARQPTASISGRALTPLRATGNRKRSTGSCRPASGTHARGVGLTSLQTWVFTYDRYYVIDINDVVWLFICPIAIAYSMGQIIKSVCVCVCVCLCVCPSASTLTVAFLDRFSPKLAQT